MTIKPWDLVDAQRRMSHAQPLGSRPLRAEIHHKGFIAATLYGEDADELKARAHRFAAAQNWHRAVVTVS